MPRFEDFDAHELRVITEAMEWSQSEFYDPGHTQDDRDTLFDLIKEAKATDPAPDFRDPAPMKWVNGIRMTEGELHIVNPDGAEYVKKEEPAGGFDRGGHPVIRRPDGSTERIAGGKPTRSSESKRERQPGEYTGFLYIECAHCGHVHAFCAKQPIRTYRCEECGGKTPLIDMYPLRVACECGARFNYMTNIVTERMDVTCYRCEAPVAVEWVDKLQKYQPMTYPHSKGRRRKGGRK